MSLPPHEPASPAAPRPAPTAPRLHDERRPGGSAPPRSALLLRSAPLRRLVLPYPQPQPQPPAPSSTMSVAGLKKQFHKATQVGRGAGARRGGPGRSREGAGSWDPARPGAAPAAPAPHPPPAAQCPASRLRTAQRGDEREGTGCPAARRAGASGGRLCKAACSPVTLRCGRPRVSRDVLARTAAAGMAAAGAAPWAPSPSSRGRRKARTGLLCINFSLGNLVVKLLPSQGSASNLHVFKKSPRVRCLHQLIIYLTFFIFVYLFIYFSEPFTSRMWLSFSVGLIKPCLL